MMAIPLTEDGSAFTLERTTGAWDAVSVCPPHYSEITCFG